jgi:phospholipase C
VFIVTFDEWGGFYDHVPPPQVIDNTNPANVMHAGDSTTPTDGRLIPNYRQLGFRVPGLVISNLALPRRVVTRLAAARTRGVRALSHAPASPGRRGRRR